MKQTPLSPRLVIVGTTTLHSPSPGFYIRFLTMCGGWACASYDLACNNPPLSTVRFTGRDFIPTPCGPCDKCYVLDTSRKKNTNNCYVPHILSPLDAQLCTLESSQQKKEE